MSDVDITQLRKLVDEAITQWVAGGSADVSPEPTAAIEDKPERTDGKRVIRTKSTGDRVYLIDETAKTKAWVTSPEVLDKLGFTLNDVQDVEDSSLVGYAMTASLYKVD